MQWLEQYWNYDLYIKARLRFDLNKAILVYFSPRSVFSGWITDFFPPLFCLLWFWCFFSFQLKEQSSGFQEVPKCTDWCLREGHDSWIQDRPDPGCHFKQSDRGEKPCLMASLPQKSDASHLGRPQKEPWRWAE